MKNRSKEAIWYDNNYYNKTEKNIPQWYLVLYPRLIGQTKPTHKILEVGCGKSYVLEKLAQEKRIEEKNIYGIEQSEVAIEYMQKIIPEGSFIVADASVLPYEKNQFDIVLLLEVIEHLEHPVKVLDEISRVTKVGGKLFLSFPNFSFFPWRMARFFSDYFKVPQLINKQPIDNIYTISQVVAMVEESGFKLKSTTGVTYLTAALSSIESQDNFAITKKLNSLGLSKYSLHPLFEFVRK